jgi:RHS repeat-associated protein
MGTVTLTYSYDGFGNRTGLTDNAGGTSATTSYTYNNNFQLSSLNFNTGSTNADLSFSYDSNTDALSTMTMTGGSDTITAAYSYGNTTMGIVYFDATTTFAAFNYTLNYDNQVTGYNGPAGSSGFSNGTLTYSYDGDGQLTGVTGAETYTYGFDSNGNRNTSGYTTSTGNEMTTAPTPGSSTLTQYTYDHDGNLSTKTDSAGDVWTYTWDYRDRLTQVVETNGTTTLLSEQLTYDVFDNLIGVAVTTGNTAPAHWTVYDGANPYIDFNTSGTPTTRYLTNPQSVDEFYGRVSSGGSVGWYFTDFTGSIREIVSESGVVQDQINYDPFGNVLYESTPANGDRFKFQGGEFDANLDLYRFGERWEDPVNGRWFSRDPAGFAAGDDNLYRFINNDPVSFYDPSGCVPTQTMLMRRPLTQSTLLLGGYGNPLTNAAVFAAGMRPPTPPNVGRYAPLMYMGFVNTQETELGPTLVQDALLQGLSDGFWIDINALSLHCNSSLNTYVNNLVEENGGLYYAANTSAHVGAACLYTAAGVGALEAGGGLLAGSVALGSSGGGAAALGLSVGAEAVPGLAVAGAGGILVELGGVAVAMSATNTPGPGDWPESGGGFPQPTGGGFTLREIWTNRLDRLYQQRQLLRNMVSRLDAQGSTDASVLRNLRQQLKALTDDIIEAKGILNGL